MLGHTVCTSIAPHSANESIAPNKDQALFDGACEHTTFVYNDVATRCLYTYVDSADSAHDSDSEGESTNGNDIDIDINSETDYDGGSETEIEAGTGTEVEMEMEMETEMEAETETQTETETRDDISKARYVHASQVPYPYLNL